MKCPECQSTYVIEMKEEETSPPKLATPTKQAEPVQMEKSQSQSSIGEKISLNCFVLSFTVWNM